MTDELRAVSNERIDDLVCLILNSMLTSDDEADIAAALQELKSLREAANNHSDHFRDATEKVCEWKPVNAYWTYRHIYVTCSGMDRYCVDPKVCPDCGGKVVVKSGA